MTSTHAEPRLVQWVRVSSNVRGQLTSAPESMSMSTNSPSRTPGGSDRADFLTCAPEPRGPFTHAAKVEVASNHTNHGGFLATHLACCGRLFHWVDILLGALG